MNQIEGTTFSLHFMHKKLRLAVEQRDSSLLWTKDWPQCLCCCSQPRAGIFFPLKTSYLEFGLIAAERDEMKGVSFTWMNCGTGGKVTIFFILLLNEALKKSVRQNIFSAFFSNPRVAVKPQQLKMFSLAPSLMHP